MPIYRKINKKFFRKWSRDMAYILGFLFADGNIICTQRGAWFWSLQITDKSIIERIKKTINSSHKIYLKTRKDNQKQLYRLQIGSKEMCADLMLLGLIPKKSKVLKWPKIPADYFSDFLRGYFDGDGGVWMGFKNKKQKNKIYAINTYFTSGSKNFLISLRNILSQKGVLGGSLVEKERGYDLKYSIKNSLILYKIMYNRRSPLFIKRKKDRFEKYMSFMRS